MIAMTATGRTQKLHYTEQEAAQELGVSIERLRRLIQQHINQGEELAASPIAALQPADLLVLRFLTQQATEPTPVG